ncbi:nucleoside deaminase [Ferrithrix thermotolerans]|nr:nucleoside deaminase [Ferrithrix thermotolerans]
MTDKDRLFMEVALEEADLAVIHGDVPIGAVCVYENEVISRRHNEKELQRDPLAHAEYLAISDAIKALGTMYLSEVTLYSTLEPCPMCAGALVLARCDRLVFGAFDPKAGAASTLYNLCCDPRLNFEVEVTSGVLEQSCAEKLSTFFLKLRSS